MVHTGCGHFRFHLDFCLLLHLSLLFSCLLRSTVALHLASIWIALFAVLLLFFSLFVHRK